jgi:hypothetical protein
MSTPVGRAQLPSPLTLYLLVECCKLQVGRSKTRNLQLATEEAK